jgi:hypothetical protein
MRANAQTVCAEGTNFDPSVQFSFDIGARNERNVRAEGFSRPLEHITFLRSAEVIRITGVHIHCVRQTRAMCGCEMRLEGFDCNPAVIFKWQ